MILSFISVIASQVWFHTMTEKNSYASMAAAQTMYVLDMRPHFTFFEQPDRKTVAAATAAVFPSDPALSFTSMTGRMLGCYRVVAHTAPTVNYVTLSRISKVPGGGMEVVQLPLQPHNKAGGGDRRGLLITIVDGELGESRLIPGSAFDAVMRQYGEVVMSSRPQIDKTTGMRNSNLMCAVDTEGSTNPLPDRIMVQNKSFLIKYKGKKWHCSSCATEHVGACPYLADFYKALEMKKQTHVSHTIIADSTLRHADHVGLKADVVCMPGATAGHIATAFEGLKSPHTTDVTIVVGANDVRTKDVTSEFVMAKKIDCSLDKVGTMIEARKESHRFLLVNSSPPVKDDSPLEKFSKIYYRERLKKKFALAEHVSVIEKLRYDDDWVDGHPTEDGTRQLVQAIVAEWPSLLLDENYIVNERTYKGVIKGYASGCAGCSARGHYVSNGFCSGCNGAINMDDDYQDIDLVRSISERVFQASFPDRRKRLHNSASSQDSTEPDPKVNVFE